MLTLHFSSTISFNFYINSSSYFTFWSQIFPILPLAPKQMHVDHIGERFRASPILGHLQAVYCHLAYLTYIQSTS